jgi:hypothetical protein
VLVRLDARILLACVPDNNQRTEWELTTRQLANLYSAEITCEVNVASHVAQNTSGRRSVIDGRITRHPGYAISLRVRKRIAEAFGWAKVVDGLRKTRPRGLPKVDWQFTFAMAAYNLIHLPKLLGAAQP